MLQLFQSNDPDRPPSKGATVGEMLARGVANVNGLHASPAVQGDLLDTFASIYQDLGDYPLALELFRRSLPVKERAYGADSLQVAITLKMLSDAARSSFKYEEGEQAVRRALQIERKREGERSADVVEAENSLALILAETGRRQEAKALYLSVLSRRDQLSSKDHLETAVLSNLGQLYQQMGDFSKAERYLAECVAIRRSTLGPVHRRLALALSKLASPDSGESEDTVS